jgi:hypothetical protein
VAPPQVPERQILSRTSEQFDILIACHAIGGEITTQKLNHHTVSQIMKQACSAEGVLALSKKYPTVPLFAATAERGKAILSSRLDVLDPSQVKPYLSKKTQDLRELQKNLVGRAAEMLKKRREVLETAEVKRGVKLTKPEKQGILARVQQLEGQEESLISSIIYKSDGKVLGSPVVNALFATYLSSLNPPASSSIPWAFLRMTPDPANAPLVFATPTATAAATAAAALLLQAGPVAAPTPAVAPIDPTPIPAAPAAVPAAAAPLLQAGPVAAPTPAVAPIDPTPIAVSPQLVAPTATPFPEAPVRLPPKEHPAAKPRAKRFYWR